MQRLLRASVLAGENHLECRLQSDESRQALGAGSARQEAQLHFGKREDRLGVIGDDAMRARQGHFQSPAQCRSMNCGDGGRTQVRESIQQ